MNMDNNSGEEAFDQPKLQKSTTKRKKQQQKKKRINTTPLLSANDVRIA